MSDCAASLEKASTMPGLVVWSSSTISSTCFPENTAGFVHGFERELGALDGVIRRIQRLGPVTGAHMPILMVAPYACALLMRYGAAIPAAIPAAKSRLVRSHSFLPEAGHRLSASFLCVLALSLNTRTGCCITNSADTSKLILRQLID